MTTLIFNIVCILLIGIAFFTGKFVSYSEKRANYKRGSRDGFNKAIHQATYGAKECFKELDKARIDIKRDELSHSKIISISFKVDKFDI